MKKNLPKLYLLIISLFVILVTPASALAATLSLSPSATTFNKGCYGTVKVEVDTQTAQTEGTDAIIKYDATKFSQVTVTNGSIYSDYPGSNVDSVNQKITIAGLASVTQPYSGKGTLATINFYVPDTAVTGPALMTFDFDANDKAKTTDSNIIERGTIADVLSSVINGNYAIGTGTCASSGIGGSLPGTPGAGGGISTPSATQPGSSYLPPAGTQELTFMIAIVGTTLTILGLIGFFVL